MIPKFRAWHPEYGLREVVGLYWHPDYVQVSLANGIATPIRTSTRYEGLKVMQATGKKDTYGVEIYEGDIIKIDSDDLYMALEVFDQEIGVVRFTEGAFYIDYHGRDTEFELLHEVDLPMKVVGNIYQHAELLGGVEDE